MENKTYPRPWLPTRVPISKKTIKCICLGGACIVYCIKQLGFFNMAWGAGDNTTSLSGLLLRCAIIRDLSPGPCVWHVLCVSCWAKLDPQCKASQLFEWLKRIHMHDTILGLLQMSEGKRRSVWIAQLFLLPISMKKEQTLLRISIL